MESPKIQFGEAGHNQVTGFIITFSGECVGSVISQMHRDNKKQNKNNNNKQTNKQKTG